MSANQNYGVMCVVSTQPFATAVTSQEKDSISWFPKPRLIYLITHRETMIGRALSSDIVLLDPMVSRVHARLVLDDQGWTISNETEQNSIYVNGCPVLGGFRFSIQSGDVLVFGATALQFVAPEPFSTSNTLVASPSSLQSSMRAQTQEWQEEEERVFRAKRTMQFPFLIYLKVHSHRVIKAIIGGVLFLVCAFAVLLRTSLLPLSILVQNGFPTILTILSIPILSALGIYLLVNFIDRFKQGPWFLRLAAFLWGAIIAIPPTQLVEQYVDSLRFFILGSDHSNIAHPIFTSLNAGITEETAKGLGLLLLFIVFRSKFHTVTSGIVYGALIGAGFAMVENFSYFLSYPKSLLFLFIGRVVLGWLNHSTFTVCFGAALGYIKHTRVRWQRLIVPLSGYLTAVGLHSAFDFVNSFASSLISSDPTNTSILSFSLLTSVSNYIPPFLAQVVILYCLFKSLTYEAAIIRKFLVSEVSAGIVTVDEYALLSHSFLRIKVERGILFRYGLKQWRRVRRLYQSEIGLAFYKWHMSMSEKLKPDLKQGEVTYRHRIRHIRQEIMEDEVVCEGEKREEGRR